MTLNLFRGSSPLNKFRKNLTQWLKERFYKLKQYMSNREDRMLVLTLTISVDIVLRRRQLYTCELEIGLVLIVAIPVISNSYRESMGQIGLLVQRPPRRLTHCEVKQFAVLDARSHGLCLEKQVKASRQSHRWIRDHYRQLRA